MCNALVEELCLFVSDCLRVSREKRENPLKFFFFFFGGCFFKSTCSWTLNMRAAIIKKKKKNPSLCK